MNKLQVKIRDRVYTLRTEEAPERIKEVASALDEKIAEFSKAMRGRPETEILTIAAFDLMEQVDNAIREAGMLRDLLTETDVKNKQQLIENMSSAQNELYQLAAVKEQENETLRAKVQEHEKAFDAHTSSTYSSAEKELEQLLAVKEKENSELRERIQDFEKQWDNQARNVFDSAVGEVSENADAKDNHHRNMSETLEHYERSFDELTKQKECEIIDLQHQVESLKMKLAECSDDGQITLV